jgi:hypothetical protein
MASFKSSEETTEPKKNQIYLQGDLLQNQVVRVIIPERLGATVKKSNFACVYIGNTFVLAYMTQVSDLVPGPFVLSKNQIGSLTV